MNTVIIFALKSLLLKFLDQVWFTSLNVDYAMNPITDTVLDVLL